MEVAVKSYPPHGSVRSTDGSWSEHGKHTFDQLFSMVDGKRVVIIGNAKWVTSSGLGERIESFDVVARINRGFPWLHPSSLGKRTDIWVINQMVGREDYMRLGFRWVLHGAPKGVDAPARAFVEMKNGTDYEREVDGWYMDSALLREVHGQLGHKSSSGLRILVLLARLCRPKSITLIGWDFLRSPTWYWQSGRQDHNVCHDGLVEEMYVQKKIPSPPIFIIDRNGNEDQINCYALPFPASPQPTS